MQFSALREQRRAAHQHCVSQYLADRLAESGYVPSGGASVIYAATPKPRSVTDAAATYDVLFVGRLQRNKGVDLLLRALAQCRTRPRAAVIGDGQEMASLRGLSDQLGISRRTDFLGWLPQEEAVSLHTTRTVLAMPSQWPEPAALVAMETAARARACLVSMRGGSPELVPHADQVVPAQTAEAWASSIDHALETDGWLASRGHAAGRLWAERFSPDVVVPAFTSLYSSMLG